MLTLDIEDNYIKMMVVRGRQVDAAATLPLEPGLIHDGVIIEPGTVGRRINELMTAQGISERKVVVSISGIHAIYRVVLVPKLSRNLLEEAARREMERVMPVPLNELYTSWQAISTSDIDTVICLVGMPRNTVDAMLETLRQAGLQPEALEVRPLALARVADEGTAIVINAQSAGFDLTLMVDGIPELLRSLPFPADATSSDDKVAEVKEELERTLTYYNSGHKGSEITQGVAAFVSGELGEILAPTLEHRVKPLPQLLSYADGLNTSEYVANIGLALRQAPANINPARVALNVTPETYLPKPFPVMQLVSWSFIVVAIAVLLLFGISTVQSYNHNIQLGQQIASIQSLVENRRGTATAVQDLQTQIQAANQAVATFKQPLDAAKAQRAKVNGDLSTITSLAPLIVNIGSITYGTGGITVTGLAPDDTVIVDYVRALRNSGRFSQVLISNMLEVEFNNWSFALIVK